MRLKKVRPNYFSIKCKINKSEVEKKWGIKKCESKICLKKYVRVKYQ